MSGAASLLNKRVGSPISHSLADVTRMTFWGHAYLVVRPSSLSSTLVDRFLGGQTYFNHISPRIDAGEGVSPGLDWARHF